MIISSEDINKYHCKIYNTSLEYCTCDTEEVTVPLIREDILIFGNCYIYEGRRYNPINIIVNY